MAIPHARAGDVVDLRRAASGQDAETTTTLIKTDAIEVIRLVLPAGKEIDPHRTPGELTLQCLEGRVSLRSGGDARELVAGQMLYLAGGQEHALRADEDSTLLLTIVLVPKGG